MTVATPGLDLATQLATNVGALTLGTNCFAGPVRPEPSEGVWVLTSGGFADTPYRETDAGAGVEALRTHAVQVFVRSSHEGFQTGEALTRTVRNALHCRPPSGYVDVRAQQSSAIYLDQDDQGRHRWSLNFLATVEETS